MAKGSFFERTKYLEDQVGTGKLVARIEVDQPYAEEVHRKSSRPLYLSGPFMAAAFGYMGRIANSAITSGGSNIQDEFVKISEDLSKLIAINAPILTGRLRASGSPSVISNGSRVYYRPPVMPRRKGNAAPGWERLRRSQL